MADLVEALDPALWFRRIEKIANGEMPSLENALRHASHLLQLTPAPFRDVVRLAIEEDRFEALLATGDFDTAAKCLIAQPAALSVETGLGEENVRATISCVILGRAISGAGKTIASAVLSAWTTCLLALKTEYGEDLVRYPARSERGGRSAQDRRLS